MTARFAPPLYPGGRLCLVTGSVTVGAVYPPPSPGGRWRWRLWVADEWNCGDGSAASELAAKNALLGRWRRFLTAAGLQEDRG